jgi:hypothetical protein
MIVRWLAEKMGWPRASTHNVESFQFVVAPWRGYSASRKAHQDLSISVLLPFESISWSYLAHIDRLESKLERRRFWF